MSLGFANGTRWKKLVASQGCVAVAVAVVVVVASTVSL